jgi:hypothetical protein
LFYDKWFRSYVSKKSGYPLVYLSSFYGIYFVGSHKGFFNIIVM